MNVRLLKAKIIEKGMTVSELSKLINIDTSTMYRYLSNNGENLSIKSAEQIKKILDLDDNTATEIFFGDNVA